MNDILMHYGTKRHSGRYPWGSGENPYQRYGDFYSRYQRCKADGLTEKQIAEQLGVVDKFGNPSIKMLRAKYSNAQAEKRAYDISVAKKYKEEGLNNSEIGRKMGINESTVRSLLDESRAQRTNLNRQTADILKQLVDDKKYVDIGPGVEIAFGVNKNRVDNAVALLEEDGYKKQFIQIDQMGTNHKTTMTVLTAPDVSYSELSENRYDICFPGQMSVVLNKNGDVGGLGLEKPHAVNPDRIQVRYNEEGGIDRDGLIQLRRGVDDLTLGGKQYAQVRIAVEGNKYLKGMAVYSDDMPPGVDIIFNTNKHLGMDKMDVFKSMETDKNGNVNWDNPFGASVTQKKYEGADGKEHLSACNVVREEGEWQTWSKNLASQFLSKQPVPLAERQLKLAADDRKREFEEICNLTNPTVKKKLLLDFADSCDSAAVDLKAAPFAGQQTHVILPFTDIKNNECYAPNYPDGTRVALIRYPHGGKFEIPELTVNNKSGSDADKTIGRNAPDAIGINSHTAGILSGADFDGDTVVVIPLSEKVRVKNSKPLAGLEGFDPKEAYPGYPGMRVISSQRKQTEMGKVTNLITDMTLKGATEDEIARAVRHSMVIIDSEKHKLNYKQSEIDNDISSLKKKYQDDGNGHTGAGTIISRSSSEYDIPVRKDWRAKEGSIDPKTGEKIFEYTNETYTKAKIKGIKVKDGGEVILNTDPKTGQRYYLRSNDISGKKERVYVQDSDLQPYKDGSLTKEVTRTQKSTKMAEANDAFTLTSGGSKDNPGQPMERVYAQYANDIKALGNAARKEWLSTPNLKYSKEAAQEYKAEVDSLNDKLKKALGNAPKERQAQLIANQVMALKKEANPDMDKDDIKKYKGQAIVAARDKVNARKEQIEITPKEWEAIQAGAISDSRLRTILDNTKTENLRAMATPRNTRTITPSMQSLAKSMSASGYTTAQIADRLGISSSSVYSIMNPKKGGNK